MKSTGGSGGVMAAARKDWVVSRLVKPSWSREEKSRSKVHVGNGVEGQRVAAGSVVVMNRW